jgi:HEAT repeat protein
LLRLLDRESETTKIAAVHALGEVGTATSVEPLLAYTKDLLPSELKRAARAAIARIQTRFGDVDAGRLSVAELEQHEGALSISAEGGELSLECDEPANRRSVERRDKRQRDTATESEPQSQSALEETTQSTQPRKLRKNAASGSKRE